MSNAKTTPLKKKFHINDFLEVKKNRRFLLVILFLSSIVIFSLILNEYSHIIYGDNQLYLDMAKSFFHDKRFQFNNMDTSYHYPVYPFLLSFVYYFYNPETILNLSRMIGVIMMASAVFPIYLLGKRMQLKWSRLFLVALFSIFNSSMMYTQFISLEPIFYTAFLWLSYLIYVEIETKKMTRNTVFLGLAFTLFYFTKNLGAIFILSYFGYMGLVFCVQFFQKKKKEVLGRLFLQMLVTGGIMVIGIIVISALLKSRQVSVANTSGDQILHSIREFFQVFDGGIRNGLLHIVQGYALYFFFFMLSLGVVTLPILLSTKSKNKNIESFKYFLCLSLFLFITAVVMLIHIKEEAFTKQYQRIHMRYVFQFFPLFWLLFMDVVKEKADKKSIFYGSFGFLALYVVFIPKILGISTQQIYDSPNFLFLNVLGRLEIENKNISFNFLYKLAFILILILILYYIKRRGISYFRDTVLLPIMAVLILLNFVRGNELMKEIYAYKSVSDEKYISLATKIESVPGRTLFLIDAEIELGPDLSFYTKKVYDKMYSETFFSTLRAHGGGLKLSEFEKPRYHYANLVEHNYYLEGVTSIVVPKSTFYKINNAELIFQSEEYKMYQLNNSFIDVEEIASYQFLPNETETRQTTIAVRHQTFKEINSENMEVKLQFEENAFVKGAAFTVYDENNNAIFSASYENEKAYLISFESKSEHSFTIVFEDFPNFWNIIKVFETIKNEKESTTPSPPPSIDKIKGAKKNGGTI